MIGIAGGGLLGRLAAWLLSLQGVPVTVFDRSSEAAPAFDGHGAAGFTAAGMLCPIAELDHCDPDMAEMGWQSIELWDAASALLRPLSENDAECPQAPLFARRGSWMLAHRSDLPAAERRLARIARASMDAALAPAHRGRLPRATPTAELALVEPALHGAAHAWSLDGEAHLDPVRLMQALFRAATAEGARWQWKSVVAEVLDGAIVLADGRLERFDHVLDLRGVGSRPDIPVRGVRGETVWLSLPGHGLSRPVRVLHPRQPVYIVPRSLDLLIVGASEIESEDRSPVSLRSAVELMATAHSVMPALAEARVVRLDRNLRPALPDNRPCVVTRGRLSRVNGLFRHGWMMAPALLDRLMTQIGRRSMSELLATQTVGWGEAA